MQKTLTLVLTLKSPADYEAVTQLLSSVKDQMDNAFRTLNIVHFARVVFLDNNTKVAVITEFDGDFPSYVQDFARTLGPVFDALFEHTVEAPPVPSRIPRIRRHLLTFPRSTTYPYRTSTVPFLI